MVFDWGSAIGAAITALGSIGTSVLQSRAEEDRYRQEQGRLDEELAYKREQDVRNLQLEALRAQFGIGKPAGPFTGLTDADRLNALNNQQSNNQAALNAIIQGFTNAMNTRL